MTRPLQKQGWFNELGGQAAAQPIKNKPVSVGRARSRYK
jgi:hypothetical protein